MRKALGLIAVASVALAVWLSPGQVLAEDAAVPNLVGTWTGPLKVLRAKGMGKGTLTIRVTDQDGALFKAEKAWETPGTVGKVGSKEVEKATEPLAGVIDFNGKRASISPSRAIMASTPGVSPRPTRASSSMSRPATAPPTGQNSPARSRPALLRNYQQPPFFADISVRIGQASKG
jgi:hypothetical protein